MGTNKFTVLSPWDKERKRRENELRRRRVVRQIILPRSDVLAGTGTDEDVTPKFTPDMLGSALQLWIDPSDTSSMVLSGSDVHSINDKSTYGRHLSAGVAKPVLSSGSIVFGPSSYLRTSSAFNVAGSEYFFAVRNTGNNQKWLLLSIGSGVPYIGVFESGVTSQSHSGEVAGGEFIDGAQISSPTRDNNYTALGTGPRIYEVRNASTNFSTALQVAGYTGWEASSVELSGMIITSTLTDAQRVQVRSYLASKQGRSF